MSSFDVISMPDPWEYPWYAAWDLAFQCVAIARVDPGFAKEQLLLLLREWYMHPNGQIPAYEWAFGDVNPPVHGWAALRVFELDGGRDFDFLARVLHKLLMNFTWWVNRKDSGGNNVFEGGFLGLDNVGPFDRRAALPVAGVLEQSDGTGWMAMYALNLLEMALVLGRARPRLCGPRDEVPRALRLHRRRRLRAGAVGRRGRLLLRRAPRRPTASQVPLKVRSVVGLLPLAATTSSPRPRCDRLPEVAGRLRWFLTNKPEYADVVGARRIARRPAAAAAVGGRAGPADAASCARMLDEEEFLSPYGLRTLSRAHLDAAVHGDRSAGNDFTVGYEPGESTTGLFGGNSNWRGPVWFPVNYLSSRGCAASPTSSATTCWSSTRPARGNKHTLGEIADDLSERLVTLFLRDADGRRPVYGAVELSSSDPDWRDLIAVPRVLPRRHRRRPGRLAPDRLDRAGRRPDPRPAKSGHGTRLTFPKTA